ncbi:MAG TPA: MarR family transcriptional regulator [Nitrospirota bacterium]|nr:MarR family transcriptional regulator [Nitrospirota bacterium]
MMIPERYQDKISGTLSCYDRMIMQGTLPGWCFDKGMTAFLYARQIKIFDYAQFAKALQEKVRENAERLANESGIDIEFIRKLGAFRKEARIKEIIRARGEQPSLVHIFSAMEACTSYKPWHDKNTGKTFLKYDSGKCLHYYFYFIDKTFGLCYLRVPTWAPFRLQFYMNGHNWLAAKLAKKKIPYVLRENAFLSIDNFPKAQELSDSIKVSDLHRALDGFAHKYCPVGKEYGLTYHWSTMQVEYATDIVFKKQSDLHTLYEQIVRTAIHSVKPENIATFLGRKLHGNYQGKMGNNFNTRIQGTRIKHHMGASSIKMYDKFGSILRIETTTNDVSEFKHYREVQSRIGDPVHKNAPMKKNIYSLFDLAAIFKASNRRYLEFISTFDDQSAGIKNLDKISKTVETDDRSYKGFNLFSDDDLKLFEVLARGEFNINGLQNKSLRKQLPSVTSSTMTRILKRLHVHGIIRKVGKTYKYYVSRLGKAVIAAGLTIRNMSVIPQLAHV